MVEGRAVAKSGCPLLILQHLSVFLKMRIAYYGYNILTVELFERYGIFSGCKAGEKNTFMNICSVLFVSFVIRYKKVIICNRA